MTKLPSSFHLRGLDGMRALAVVAVVWHHAHPGYAWLPLTRNGFLGVDVFFVLSGFLITTLLLAERRDRGAISLRNFYVRRSLRIFPIYYLMLGLLAMYFAFATKSPNAAVFLRELPWHASYISNWTPLHSLMAITWSLSTEEQFYLVWPPLLAWLGLRSLGLVIIFLLINQLVNFGLLNAPLAAAGLIYSELPILQVTFTPILLGVLLAWAYGNMPVRQRLQRAPAWALPTLVVLTLGLASIPGDLGGLPRLAFHLATAGVIALVVSQPESAVVRALEWRPLVFVGAVSYGVYLFHMLVLHVADRALEAMALSSPSLRFMFALAGTIGLAALSYRWFEAPILALKERFR